MDDLLLFKPTKKSHIAKLEDSLKVLLKMDLRFHQRSVNCLEENYNTWVLLFLLKTREFASNHYEIS